MVAPIVGAAALVAARLAAKQAAKKVVKKTVKKGTEVKRLNPSGKTIKQIRQRAEANRIAKDSVKVRPANKSKPTNEVQNTFTNNQLKRIKSGDAAKGQMRLEEKRNQISNQFFGKSPTIRVKSSEVKPYKVTGGAGSTARRAAEKAKAIKTTAKKTSTKKK